MAPKGYAANVLYVSCTIFIISYFIQAKIFPNRINFKKSIGYPKNSLLNFTELSSEYGYLAEEHTVVTEDGYVLKMFRMAEGRNCKGKVKKPPVILMHGLLQTSNAWLDAGPNAGLAYLLSDACFDLWTGNSRGNYYSRDHTSLNPDKDAKFWDFSVDELGRYDLPAMIDYVLEYSGSGKVNYVGYSQGSGMFFVMCSEVPQACDKVNLHIGLAPAGRLLHTKSVSYRVMLIVINKLYNVLTKTGVHEIFSKGGLGQEFLAFVCQWRFMSNEVCGKLEGLLDSNHPGSISNETQRVLFGHFPAGTSVKNLARYGQSMQSPRFEKFDYGLEKNLEKYGRDVPPLYNLSLATLPVYFLHGNNDYLVDTKDVVWLGSQLKNFLGMDVVDDPLWNHLDVPYSQRSGELVFPKVLEYLEKYSLT